MLENISDVIQWVVDLGSYIFMPILMCVIGLIFGLKPGKAIKSGAMVGIGLVGVSLVSTLTSQSVGVAIQTMVERFGLNLTAIDVGGSPAAAVGFSSLIGAALIVIIIAVNIALVALKLTNTVNVDVYNFWYFAITAGFVQLITGNFWLGVLAGVTHAILGLKISDMMARRTQGVIGIPAISIPHGFAAASAPLFLVLDKIYDRIPFFANKPLEEGEEELAESHGLSHWIGVIFGDRVYLGLILGVLFGVLAGYDFKGVADITIKTAALLELFPTVLKMLVNGLIPVSTQAKEFFKKHFPDRPLTVGLDSAVTIGHPVTVSVGFLMIPVFMLVAVILPGNITLPLGEVPFAAFYVCFATIIHRANRRRVICSSLIFIPLVLWISSWAAPYFTQLATAAGMDLVANGQMATTMAFGDLFILVPTLLASVPMLGPVLLVALIVVAIAGGKVLEKFYAAEDEKFEETIGIESM